MAVLTVALVVFGAMINHRHRRDRAVSAIQQEGGHLITKYAELYHAPSRSHKLQDRIKYVNWQERVFGHTYLSVRLTKADLDDDIMRDLESLYEIQFLLLSGARFRETEFKRALGSLHHLHGLSLSGCPITDDSAAQIGACKQLHQLDLSYTGITDATLPHLQNLKQLETCDLRGTQVTEAGLVSLKSLTNLREVKTDHRVLAK
jgi:hypothetical protein